MSADSVVFRIATVRDAHRLAAARWAFRTEAGETPIESESAFAVRYEAFFKTVLDSGHYTYWIAETAPGTLIAHMAVCVVHSVPRPSRPADQWGYLTDCYTRPPFRNRGIGRQLLAHVIEWARAHDLEQLIVWPSERAQNFYATAGFGRDAELRVLPLRPYDGSPDARSASPTEQSDDR